MLCFIDFICNVFSLWLLFCCVSRERERERDCMHVLCVFVLCMCTTHMLVHTK
jgi:hypothetical protein